MPRRAISFSHRRWMIQQRALTFAAVTLRIYLPIAIVARLDVGAAPIRRSRSWAWIPNLIVAEL